MAVRSRIAVFTAAVVASAGLVACGGGSGAASKDDLKAKLKKEGAPASMIDCITDEVFKKLNGTEVQHLIDAKKQSDATEKEVSALSSAVSTCASGGTLTGTGSTDTGSTTDTGSFTDTTATDTGSSTDTTSTTP